MAGYKSVYRCFQTRWSELAHVDLSAAILELDGVHHAINEVDPAAVVSVDILALAATGNAGGIESVSGIADHDQDAMLLVARNGAVNLFAGIAFAAVDDGIGESFAQ